MATLAQRKQALYALFGDEEQRPVAGLTQTAAVFKGEPRPGDNRPGPVGITVATGKGTYEVIEFQVRVYGKTEVGALEAQDAMDITIQEVWTILEEHPTFVVPGFEMGYSPELGLLVATFKVSCARGDLV